jgi:hypothetical protein
MGKGKKKKKKKKKKRKKRRGSKIISKSDGKIIGIPVF